MRRVSGETPDRFIQERNESTLNDAERNLFKLSKTEMNKHRISMQGFADLYGQEQVDDDTKQVIYKKQKWNEEIKADPIHAAEVVRGKLLEYILAIQIEESNWLGPEAEVILTAEFDDFFNYIDEIIKFGDIGENDIRPRLALSIDATDSSTNLDKKFKGIQKTLESGKLSKAKYFEDDDFRGELKMLPRVIIGVDRKTTTELAELVYSYKTLKGSEMDNAQRKKFLEVRNALAEHPAQYKILMEVKMQLKAFEEYADSWENEEAARVCRRMYNVVEKIFKEKIESEQLLSKIDDDPKEDPVYSGILAWSKDIRARASQAQN